MEHTLLAIINQIKLKKIGSSYFLGSSKVPLDGKKLLAKIDDEITSNNAPKAILDMIDALLMKIEKEMTANQKPEYDKSSFSNALNRIMEHEKCILDFELMEYKKIVGFDNKGEPIGITVPYNELVDAICANEDARSLNTGDKNISKELLTYMKYHNNNLRNDALGSLITDLRHIPEYAGFFDQFAKELHSVYNCKEDLDIFTTLCKQHWWQIKRRAMGRSVHNDVMLTFRGAQGIGKTYLINALFGILGKFINKSAKLDDICDERWTPALGNMLLVNIDETDTGKLGKMHGKQMGTVKRLMTNDIFTYRPLGTNSTVEVHKKATFISTSNFHIYEIMEDESGMRRFFEFNSLNELQSRFDYARVARLGANAMKAFQSIDEDLEYGYWDINSEVGRKITEVQSTYVTKSPIQDFIDTLLEFLPDATYAECMSIDKIYSMYTEYSKAQGVKDNYLITKKNFRRKMEDTVYDCTKMSHNIYKFKFEVKRADKNIKGEN